MHGSGGGEWRDANYYKSLDHRVISNWMSFSLNHLPSCAHFAWNCVGMASLAMNISSIAKLHLYGFLLSALPVSYWGVADFDAHAHGPPHVISSHSMYSQLGSSSLDYTCKVVVFIYGVTAIRRRITQHRNFYGTCLLVPKWVHIQWKYVASICSIPIPISYQHSFQQVWDVPIFPHVPIYIYIYI